jgi:phosphoglycerate dehydrogenase-like enzyme
MEKLKPVILVASQSFWPVRDLVNQEIFKGEFELVQSMDFEISPERRKDVVAIILADQKVDASLMDMFPNLKTLARTGTGYDNIDIPEAEKRNICVTRVSELNAESVSEFALGLLMALSRNIIQTHIKMLNKIWERGSGLLIKEMTVGIVGLGAVGRSLTRRLHSFGVGRLIGWNRSTFRLEVNEVVDECGLELLALEQVLKESDAVIVALALTAETRNLIDRKMLSNLSPHSLFINVGRGAVANEQCLSEMILENKLGGIGLDVYSVEPPDNPFEILFAKNFIEASRMGRNVILTPHNAATTKNSSKNIAMQVGRNVLKVLQGETEGLEIVKADQR